MAFNPGETGSGGTENVQFILSSE